jgi:hypothetical protein
MLYGGGIFKNGEEIIRGQDSWGIGIEEMNTACQIQLTENDEKKALSDFQIVCFWDSKRSRSIAIHAPFKTTITPIFDTYVDLSFGLR